MSAMLVVACKGLEIESWFLVKPALRRCLYFVKI